MIFVMNGSKKRTLESFNENKNETNNEKRELGKTMERQIINNYFYINMIDRIKPSTNCSSCGKQKIFFVFYININI